jgi:hypothetical protein
MEADEKMEPELNSKEVEIPLCLRCMQPVDPLAHYCPNCGQAVGQLTPYIPYVNIPWETRIWGQMWEQVWSKKTSLAGRLVRLLMIVWNVPVMLLGLIPILWHRFKRERKL